MTVMGKKKTTKPKPMKRKAIKKKMPKDGVLDTLVRKIVYMKSGGYCKRCGKLVGVEFIEASHLFKRRRKTVRWDLRNVQPLCKNDTRTGKKGCHEIVDNDPIAMSSFMYDVLSGEDVADLQRLANMTIREYPIDREAVKERLTKLLGGTE